MILIKILVIIILILILIFILIVLNKNRSFFQSGTETTAVSENIDTIKLIADTTDYNTINLATAKIKMNPQYNNNNYDINIGNDILVEDNIKIHGKVIDIDTLRYIKKLPIHYQDEICLKDNDGIDCIKKEHIDIIKGAQPINIVSYPDNYRKCISSYERDFLPDWWSEDGDGIHSVYTPVDCKDGNIDTQFFIKRDHEHDEEKIHYHVHGIDTEMHNNIDTSIDTSININNSSDLPILRQPSLINFNQSEAVEMGILEDEFNTLDALGDGLMDGKIQLSAHDVFSHTG
jgi:hypothetical protein